MGKKGGPRTGKKRSRSGRKRRGGGGGGGGGDGGGSLNSTKKIRSNAANGRQILFSNNQTIVSDHSFCKRRIDLALEGLHEYLKEGEPDGAALELVVARLSKAGRLKDASELLLEAINEEWIGIVPLEKTTAILAGMSMKCAKEDDYAREFVEVDAVCFVSFSFNHFDPSHERFRPPSFPQGLATVTDFGDTNEEAARDYYRRLAIGQVVAPALPTVPTCWPPCHRSHKNGLVLIPTMALQDILRFSRLSPPAGASLKAEGRGVRAQTCAARRGQVLEYLEEARVAMDKARTHQASVLCRQVLPALQVAYIYIYYIILYYIILYYIYICIYNMSRRGSA